MLNHAQNAVVAARGFCPVLTGFLQSKIDIIDWQPIPSPNVSVTFGVSTVEVHYADFVEYGTCKMRARPYLKPAAFTEFYNLITELTEMAHSELEYTKERTY